MFYIYLLQNKINNKIYIGKAKNFKNRLSQHFTHAKKPVLYKKMKQYHYIHNSINKYGKNNFTYMCLESFDYEIDAFNAEAFWIDFFRSWDRNFGYNLTRGGEGISGFKLSAEAKMKISKSLIGNQRAKGVIHTETWKKDMSIKHAGEKNARAKITVQDVLDIRKFHAENNFPNIFKHLSDKYGLSISGLEKIIYRKTWKHI